LHDAFVLSRVELTQALGDGSFSNEPRSFPFPLWSAAAIVSVTLEAEIVSLISCLSDHVTTVPAPPDWRFSKLQEHWLYDDRKGPFVHRILLSTGITLEIPFVSSFTALLRRSAKALSDRPRESTPTVLWTWRTLARTSGLAQHSNRRDRTDASGWLVLQ
jgi:hypothetical protein